MTLNKTFNRLCLLVLLLVSFPLHVLAQGTVAFNNGTAVSCQFGCATVGCTVVYDESTGAPVPAGSAFKAALFYLPYTAGDYNWTIYSRFSVEATQISPAVDMIAPGRFNGGIISTPTNTPPGGEAWFQVRVWESAFGDTYEQARNNTNLINGRRGKMSDAYIRTGLIKVQTGNPGANPPTSPGSLISSIGMGLCLVPNRGSFVSVDDVSVSPGTTGTVSAIFPVRVRPFTCTNQDNSIYCSGSGARIRFATADCTAVAGVDYQPLSGFFDFEGTGNSISNWPTVYVPVVISPNPTLRSKKFFLNLNSLDATFVKAQAVCEILPATGPTACDSAPCGLVSWWPGAGNASDIIGTNNGTMVNGTTNAVGKVGQAFSFDGVNDGIDLGNVPAFDFGPNDNFTIEAWINYAGFSDLSNDGQVIVALNNDCGNVGETLALVNGGPNGGKVDFVVRDANGLFGFVRSPAALSANAFHHIAAVREVIGGSKTLRLYIDGLAAGTATDSSTGSLALNASDWIGRRNLCGTLNVFNGLIDEVSIYNRALATSEIQAIHAAGSAGKCLNPLYITSVNRTGNSVNLSWSAQKGMGYRVQYTTNLNSSAWSNLPPDVTATNSTVSQTDSTLGNAAQRFYRVQLLQ